MAGATEEVVRSVETVAEEPSYYVLVLGDTVVQGELFLTETATI